MTNTQINQIIHEAMGLCWHERTSQIKDMNPDYTSDWSAYGMTLEWAQKQKWWAVFAYEMRPVSPVHNILNAFLRDELLFPSEGSTALAAFIIKHPDYFKKGKEIMCNCQDQDPVITLCAGENEITRCCGKTPKVYTMRKDSDWVVHCPKCWDGTEPFETRAQAIESWNKAIR